MLWKFANVSRSIWLRFDDAKPNGMTEAHVCCRTQTHIFTNNQTIHIAFRCSYFERIKLKLNSNICVRNVFIWFVIRLALIVCYVISLVVLMKTMGQQALRYNEIVAVLHYAERYKYILIQII